MLHNKVAEEHFGRRKSGTYKTARQSQHFMVVFIGRDLGG